MVESPLGQLNFILASLAPGRLAELSPLLHQVELAAGSVVQERGQASKYIYFPLSAVGSVVGPGDHGEALEVATIGHDGYSGLPALIAAGRSSVDILVQIPGAALRMDRTIFQRAAVQSPLSEALQRYSQALTFRMVQTAVCIGTHKIEARCARWLLQAMELTRSETFLLTQQALADLLGIRRASVNEAAEKFQAAGLISYSRGVINIDDQRGLERLACSCYRRLERETVRRVRKGAGRQDRG